MMMVKPLLVSLRLGVTVGTGHCVQ